MPSSLGAYFVDVLPDFSKTGPKIARELPKHVPASAGRKLGGSIGANLGGGIRVGMFGQLRNMAGLLGGAFAAVKSVQIFGSFITDARESAKIGRITAQVLKTTAGAANVTARDVDRLSQSLSNQTAIDDELVQTGANLLLTFKNVRNEPGKGNDIFNQATAAALDLSAAGFGSVDSAAKMLGKALNDPLKGLTALGRAGVTFTKGQREQIEAMVEAGDVLGAQRIIMQEVASQVGGAAAAAADPMQRLRVVAENLGERVGTALLPMIEDVATWLGDNLPRAIDAGQEAIGGIIAGFRDGETSAQGWMGVLQDAGAVARDVFEWIKDPAIPTLKDLVGWVKDNEESLTVFVATLGFAYGAFKAFTIITTVTTALKALRPAIIAVNLALAANPILAVVALIGFLVTAFITAYNTSEDFRNNVKKAWADIQRAFWTGVQAVANFMLTFAELILDGAEAAFGWVPGLGDKLRTAQGKLSEFRHNVNTELDKLKNKNVAVSIDLSTDAAREAAAVKATFTRYYASGGAVFGSGGPTADQVNAKLSAGEHVWTAAEVDAFGGHGAMQAFRKQVLSGQVHGYARGGMVISAHTPSRQAIGGAVEDIDSAITDYTSQHAMYVARQLQRLATQQAKNLLTSGATFGALSTGLASGPGGWVFPLPRGRYTVGRGPVGHGYNAYDFPAAYGTPIYAAKAGMVSRAADLTYSYGRHVYINHAGGWQTRYAHMARRLVGAGQMVRAGQQIGLVDSTGNSTGNHLHLEALLGGTRVNPRGVWRFDSGGWLPPGLSLAFNGTGRPERVTASDHPPMELSDRSIRKLADQLARTNAAAIGSAQRQSAHSDSVYVRTS
jgi:murein DD-endopeptidase MepM/ murein hydrolase activator NlpD